MNQLVPKAKTTPSNQSKEEKTTKTPVATGIMKMVNGVVVMLPPDEGFEGLTEKDIETVLERNQDFVAVRVNEPVEEVPETQHVIDPDSEDQSREYAAKIREENAARADAARVENKPRKVGNTIVTDSNSYSDIELFEEQVKAESDYREKNES